MYQKIMIIGRLGKDPEMRFTPDGQPVTSFSVATDRQWKDKDGQSVKDTTWFRVQAWGRLAESCSNYLQKGKMVMVEGHLGKDPKTGGPRIWKGTDDLAHANFEIVASVVKFLSPANPAGGQVEYSDDDPTTNTAPEPDDIPF